MSLFREEVGANRRSRVHGDVVITQTISTRLVVFAMTAIVIAVIVWVLFGTYARTEEVPGILVTSKPSTKVLINQPGTVTELYAKEGQMVAKGQRLLIVTLARRSTTGRDLASGGLDTIDNRSDISRTQIQLSAERAEAEKARLSSVVKSSDGQINSLREQIKLQEQLVNSNREIYEQISRVVEKGFVSRVEYERRHQVLLSSQQSLSSLRQQLIVQVAEGEQAKAQMRAASINRSQEITQIETQLQSLAQQRMQLQGEQGYVIIAPIAGRVTALQTSLGRTALPNIPLMVIVPEASPLKVELYAPSRAVGFVQEGQEVRIMFDAFPYQRFGSFGGRVSSVSGIIIDPRENEVSMKLEEASYRVTVLLDSQSIHAYGERLHLQPGMTLQANLVLERRTFMSWLLSPINAVRKRTT